MDHATPRLVVIDDDPKLAATVGAIAREAFPDPNALTIESYVTAEAAMLGLQRLGHAAEISILVISDLHLPPSPIDGLYILAEVRRRLPNAKRVLMTGRDRREFADHLDHVRLDAFVEKPFTYEDMRALIESFVAETVNPPCPRPLRS